MEVVLIKVKRSGSKLLNKKSSPNAGEHLTKVVSRKNWNQLINVHVSKKTSGNNGFENSEFFEVSCVMRGIPVFQKVLATFFGSKLLLNDKGNFFWELFGH